VYGRAQSVQHVLRGAALGLALVVGGFLLHYWHAAPFVLATVVTTATCGAVVLLVEEAGGHERLFKGIGTYLRTNWRIVRTEPQVLRWLFANTAWEGTFAAMRTFVVLYITKGLHQPLSVSSLVLTVVAAGYIVAAIGSGRFGDRYGLARVIIIASFVYGGGLLACGLAESWHDWFYAAIFPVAIAGGVVMTLAWGLLFKLMPAEHRGAVSGLAILTKGAGLIGGPLGAGALIDIVAPYLPKTNGYQVLWPLCGLPILLAIPIVAALLRREPSGKVEPLPG
jgi:MFS family permease